MIKLKESDFSGLNKRVLLASDGEYRLWAEFCIDENDINYIITNTSWGDDWYLSYLWLDVTIDAWNKLADEENNKRGNIQ